MRMSHGAQHRIVSTAHLGILQARGTAVVVVWWWCGGVAATKDGVMQGGEQSPSSLREAPAHRCGRGWYGAGWYGAGALQGWYGDAHARPHSSAHLDILLRYPSVRLTGPVALPPNQELGLLGLRQRYAGAVHGDTDSGVSTSRFAPIAVRHPTLEVEAWFAGAGKHSTAAVVPTA